MRRIEYIALSAIAVFVLLSAPYTSFAAFSYYRTITVTSTATVASGTQVNFPLLVNIASSSYLQSTSTGGRLQNTNGYDLIFATSTACASPLNFETEAYSSSTGQLIDWVQVPSLSTGTLIYMCYGNPAATSSQANPAGVWTGYGGVWHLPDGHTLTAQDSTGNGNNGSISAASSTPGEIDGAANFAGAGGISLGSSSLFDFVNGDMTLSAWMRTTSTGISVGLGRYSGSGDNYWIGYGVNSSLAHFSIDGNGVDGPSSIGDGNWHLVTATRSSQIMTLYVDGIPGNTITNFAEASPAGNLAIGRFGDFSSPFYWTGSIDEARVSGIAESPSWITTEYHNQSSPSTFYNIGSETSLITSGPGAVNATVMNESRAPVVGATVKVICGAASSTLGVTNSSGTIEGIPTGCTNGTQNIKFQVSGSGFPTQTQPFITTSTTFIVPYYTDIDPNNASSSHDGSSNNYVFGVEATSSYGVKFWNMAQQSDNYALNTPFPTSTPDATTSTTVVNLTWPDDASPIAGIQGDYWWAQFQKTTTLGAGWYEFDISSDDGSRVFLDGTQIISDWQPQGFGTLSVAKKLVSGGSHTVTVQYYEGVTAAQVQFSFYPINQPPSPVLTASNVSSSIEDIATTTISLNTTIAGSLSYGGDCTGSGGTSSIGVGTSTVSLPRLADGTYNSCNITLTDPLTGLTASTTLPTFTVTPPPTHHIASCVDLQAADSVSSTAHDIFVLDNDIDCSNVNGTGDFTPLNWNDGPEGFYGTFDGQGHTISNLTIYKPNLTFVGLFFETLNATIRNVHLSDGSVMASSYAGSLIGSAENTVLQNITSNVNLFTVATSTSPTSFIGGIVGRTVFSANGIYSWSNLEYDGALTIGGVGGSYFGGLTGGVQLNSVGGGSANMTLTAATTSVAITANDSIINFNTALNYAGGLMGQVYAEGGGATTSTIVISNTLASTTIAGISEGEQIGGFAGYVSAAGSSGGVAEVDISSSTAQGSISVGDSNLGGFVGETEGQDDGTNSIISIRHDAAHVTVTAGNNDSSYVGGFLGSAEITATDPILDAITLDNDYATGNVTGFSQVGGFLGNTYSEVNLSGGATGGLSIDQSDATGNVIGNVPADSGTDIGGFAGNLRCISDGSGQPLGCSVTNSYAIGNVTGDGWVGGFVGYVGQESELNHVYAAKGDIGNSGMFPTGQTGALAGSFDDGSTIANSFSAGRLENGGGGFVGGFGFIFGTATNTYYDGQTTGATACVGGGGFLSAGCTAVDTATSSAPSYFFNNSSSAPLNTWDFSNLWLTHPTTYPTLLITGNFIADSTTTPGDTTTSPGPGSGVNIGVASIGAGYITTSTSTFVASATPSSFSSSSSPSSSTTENTAITSPPPVCAFTRALHQGMNGTDVEALQVFLNARGFGVATSGYFGIQTKTALARFQSENNVTPAQGQGVFGPLSHAIICGETSFPTSFTRDLTIGMSGVDVEALQQYLTNQGYPILNGATGYFGLQTQKALAAFQKANGITPAAGYFGSKTFSYIKSRG